MGVLKNVYTDLYSYAIRDTQTLIEAQMEIFEFGGLGFR